MATKLGTTAETLRKWVRGVTELRRLRSLEDEKARLKRLVADLSLDKHILTEAMREDD